jgi:hypothetical protein
LQAQVHTAHQEKYHKGSILIDSVAVGVSCGAQSRLLLHVKEGVPEQKQDQKPNVVKFNDAACSLIVVLGT